MTWWWNHGVPAALFVLGAIILTRLTRWIADRYEESLDRQAREAMESGGLVSEQTKRSRALAQAVTWGLIGLFYLVGLVVALQRVGIPLASLVAPATIAGVAIGFGAQQLVGDLLAGFFLFAEHQFGVGDLVRLSMPGQLTGITGTVEELTLRVTKLRSTQGELVVVPNSALRQVTNLSRDWSRVVLDVPVAVEENLQRVMDLIAEVAQTMAAEPRWSKVVVGDPVMAGVQTIEVGYVQLRVLVRTLPGRQFEVSQELRLRVVTALRESGVHSVPTAADTGTASP